GYPERLFYPPGTMIVGWLLNWLTLGKLSTALIYESIIFIAYALPAFTFYYALRRLGFERRAAFAAGMFTLGFPTFFDGAHAVVIGMTGSRLSFGLNALVLVWTIDGIETRRSRYVLLAVLTLAFAILFHPYHSIGLILALALYVLVRRWPLGRAFVQIAGIAFGALALDAFWLVPMFAHSSSAMIPHIRATLDQMWRLLTDIALMPYALLALIVVTRVRTEYDAARRAFLIVLLVLPIVLATIMLAWYVLMIEHLYFYQLDPVRLIGEFYFAIILLAALGLSVLSEWLSRFVPPRARTPLATFIVLFVSIVLLIPFVQTSAHFPRPNGEPRFLSQAIRDYRLDELWQG
ncbi:MAG: 6-pyruvoyl-tetrahydropterin synthase-related protein, partial [Anaerolineae bacterium]|nr:6-pyruvoyl-tetrahydropterin synthase-related protein [Anaerolineae bacterium]